MRGRISVATSFDRILAMKSESLGHHEAMLFGSLFSGGNGHFADHKFDLARIVLNRFCQCFTAPRLRIVSDINKRPRRWEARAKSPKEETCCTLTKKGPARQKSFSFFAVYLREYRAEILESAAWLQCPDDTATGIPMRLAGSA